MGAFSFENTVMNPDVRKAFDHAHSEAQYQRGHGGYSGTIAEKPGYHILSRTPLAGDELADFIQKRTGDNDKWGPAFAVPLANVTKGKTTTKTVTVRAKSESEAREAAAAKIRKSRKGDVRVGITKITRTGSSHSNKMRRKKHGGKVKVQWAWSDRQPLHDTPLDAAKAAEEYLATSARNLDAKGIEVHYTEYRVFPVVTLVGNDGTTRSYNKEPVAYTVTIGRNDKTATWEVTAEVQPIKVERTIAGWVFFGYASS